MSVADSLTYKIAVSMLVDGNPLPLDMETELMQMGVDVVALKDKYEL